MARVIVDIPTPDKPRCSISEIATKASITTETQHEMSKLIDLIEHASREEMAAAIKSSPDIISDICASIISLSLKYTIEDILQEVLHARVKPI